MNCYYILPKDLQFQNWIQINDVGDPQLRSYSIKCDSAFYELQLFDADLSQLVVGLTGKGLFVICKQNETTFTGHSTDGTTLLEKKTGDKFSFTMTSFAFCNFIRTKEYTCEYIIPPTDVHNYLYDSKWTTSENIRNP